jgi:prephenate dehydratase
MHPAPQPFSPAAAANQPQSKPNPIIAIQGEQASFHDVAAEQFFGADTGRVFSETFEDAFRALHDGSADFTLCAIENSLYGSINTVYDLLTKYHCHIFGEVYLRIEQCLIGLPGTKVTDIKAVYSHPVALAQCEAYLDAILPEADRHEHHDTAGSVAFIKKLGDPAAAAIASREAAELYGLEVLAESIETNKENYTRFVCLAPSEAFTPPQANKSSVVITTSHTPGALYRALGSFAERGINISKIQSRPIIGEAWSYMFYLDVHAGIQDNVLQAAFHELATQDCTIKVLGSYTNALNA